MARRDALTRESIVSATREMLRTTDLDQVSLRKLAGVLGVTALARDGARAAELAREAASRIQFEGAFFRRDIGASLSGAPAGQGA